jgi:hypothetical protein
VPPSLFVCFCHPTIYCYVECVSRASQKSLQREDKERRNPFFRLVDFAKSYDSKTIIRINGKLLRTYIKHGVRIVRGDNGRVRTIFLWLLGSCSPAIMWSTRKPQCILVTAVHTSSDRNCSHNDRSCKSVYPSPSIRFEDFTGGGGMH